MDLIYRHPPSDGELWQGDRYDVEAPTEKPDVVVLMACEYQPSIEKEGRVRYVIHSPIDDSLAPDPREVKLAREVAARVADHVAKGRRVLVTCNMGLNRSGLVSALALRRLGFGPGRALQCVRKARAEAAKRAGKPCALANPTFAKLALSRSG